MKKIVAAIFFCLIVCVLVAPGGQARSAKLKKEAPDLEAIRRQTLDPSSPFYFPKLRAKYVEDDTLMTPEEFRNYYLGYMFQEDYDPYRRSVYAETTDSMLQIVRAKVASDDSTYRARKERHESAYELHHLASEFKEKNKREQREIIKLAERALADNPFDLNTIWLYKLVAHDMDKQRLSAIWDYRFANLIGAIVSTGTGLDKEHAFYVTSPDHEYAVLDVMGYRPVEYDDSYFDEGYDYITVEPLDPSKKSSSTPKGFYFNVKKPIEEYARKHPGTDGQSAE